MTVLQEAFRAHAGSESERTIWCCSVILQDGPTKRSSLAYWKSGAMLVDYGWEPIIAHLIATPQRIIFFAVSFVRISGSYY